MARRDGCVAVLAIDPGTWSGVSWARLRAGRWTREEVKRSVALGTGGTCEVTGPTEPHRAWALLAQIGEVEADVVVIEDFVLYPGRTHVPAQRSGTEPMRLIAMIDFAWFLASEVGDDGLLAVGDEMIELPRLVKQMASERLDITEAMVKEVGLWLGKSGQGRGKDSLAASQHLLHYIKKVNDSMRKDR